MRQAEQALRIFFVNFLKRTDWHRWPTGAVVGEQGRRTPWRRWKSYDGASGPGTTSTGPSPRMRTGCDVSSPTWPGGRASRASRPGCPGGLAGATRRDTSACLDPTIGRPGAASSDRLYLT